MAPYWKARGKITGREDLLRAGELSELLKTCGSKVKVILAANDPLNEPGAAERLAAGHYGCKVVLLPRGGHLGFADSRWCHHQLDKLFEDTVRAPAPESQAPEGSKVFGTPVTGKR